MVNTCPGCGSSNPADFDDSNGRLVCTNCGGVVNDSYIVSEITFGETSSGAAVVQGSYVGEGQTHVGSGGRFRSGNALESREATISAGRRKIVQLGSVLNCPEHFTDAAQRWFTLAVTNNFTKGRKTQYVVASCLYIVCRQQKSSHMLIDFSDLLHINVFVLGQTYLKLVRILNISMPNIDPTVYVYRFAKHLEFGAEQNKVAKDALRLIQRMNRDWIVQGRRPSGICGAALILAARMNNFRRSVREVVYIVKVADLTVQKRLDEFKKTKSGDLTVEEFRNIWLEQAHDPPCFGPKAKKRKRVRQVNDDGEVIPDEDEESNVQKKRKGKDGEVIPGDEEEGESNVDGGAKGKGKEKAIDTSETLADPTTTTTVPRLDEDGFTIPEIPPVDHAITTPPSKGSKKHPQLTEQEAHDTAIAEEAIENEISALLNDEESALVVEELRKAHQKELDALPKNLISDDPDDLGDVDQDPDVLAAIMTDKEAELKERIWTEFNKDYLRELHMKRLKEETDARHGIVKNPPKRRKTAKPRDSNSADLPATPAEAATQMLMKKGFSNKINYQVMKVLFPEGE